jgi:23S rRNA (guanosine2251-2'-O)-methyltransferase
MARHQGDSTDVIIGLHAVESALKHDPGRVTAIYYRASRKDRRLDAVLALVRGSDVRLVETDERELTRLAGPGRHQGVVASYRAGKLPGESALLDLLDRLQKPPLLLVLDGITDPHNLGACLRTADAAGVDAVIIPKDNAVGLTPAARKVASGAADTVLLVQVTNLSRTLDKLKAAGIWIAGTTGDADTSLFQQDLKGPLALVMGAEGKGLRRLTQARCDFLISIPMVGQVESLNISVAAGVCLYEAFRQRQTGA